MQKNLVTQKVSYHSSGCSCSSSFFESTVEKINLLTEHSLKHTA